LLNRIYQIKDGIKPLLNNVYAVIDWNCCEVYRKSPKVDLSIIFSHHSPIGSKGDSQAAFFNFFSQNSSDSKCVPFFANGVFALCGDVIRRTFSRVCTC